MATGQLFSRTTQSLFYNYKQLYIQRMLDFDFLCGLYRLYHLDFLLGGLQKMIHLTLIFVLNTNGSSNFVFLGRETPSVSGIISPGSEGFQKLFFGQEEIAIPVHATYVLLIHYYTRFPFFA